MSDYKPIRISYGELNSTAIGDTDLIVLSGGHQFTVLWHNKEYEDEIRLIQEHNGPIIGICLGFELIAHVFGSHLHSLGTKRKGEISITPVQPNAIVPAKTSLRVYENHTWSVQKLKSPLEALAVSEDGIEVMKHAARPIYGLQFHPEKSSESGRAILANIVTHVSIKRN